MGRWIKLHCQLAHHDLWLMEPFTRGQAWVDLLMLAQTKPGWIMVRGISVDLDRGQVGYSELSLSERWKWSRGKVRRFISELKKREMVDVKQDNKTTVISVLNFDTYQARPTADDTADDTASGTTDGQQTDNRRTLTRKKDFETGKREEINTSAKTPKSKSPKVPAVYSQDFEEFWAVYPARNGQKTKKAQAWASFWKLISADNGITAEIITDRIKALAPQYGDFPRDAVTWLNQRGWEDEVAPVKLRPSTGSKVDRAIANGQEWLAMQEIHQ